MEKSVEKPPNKYEVKLEYWDGKGSFDDYITRQIEKTGKYPDLIHIFEDLIWREKCSKDSDTPKVRDFIEKYSVHKWLHLDRPEQVYFTYRNYDNGERIKFDADTPLYLLKKKWMEKLPNSELSFRSIREDVKIPQEIQKQLREKYCNEQLFLEPMEEYMIEEIRDPVLIEIWKEFGKGNLEFMQFDDERSFDKKEFDDWDYRDKRDAIDVVESRTIRMVALDFADFDPLLIHYFMRYWKKIASGSEKTRNRMLMDFLECQRTLDFFRRGVLSFYGVSVVQYESGLKAEKVKIDDMTVEAAFDYFAQKDKFLIMQNLIPDKRPPKKYYRVAGNQNDDEDIFELISKIIDRFSLADVLIKISDNELFFNALVEMLEITSEIKQISVISMFSFKELKKFEKIINKNPKKKKEMEKLWEVMKKTADFKYVDFDNESFQ
ncbi:MAG: hypothetical protein ACTSUK_03770 [Promethearchaeota archaeon]